METANNPKQADGVFRQELDAEAVLYHAATGKVHILNKTAERIWELCDGQHSVAEMETDLRARFQIAPDTTVDKDIKATLAQFAADGLLAEQALQEA